MGRDRKTLRLLQSFENVDASEHYMSFDYGELYTVESATTEKTDVSGASVTWTSAIPAGADVLGVLTRVTTAIGETNSTTGYQVGDGSDVDIWGDITGVADGTTSDPTDFTDTGRHLYTSATNIVLTAAGGNFDGDGDIRITVVYRTLTAPTS